MKKVKKIICLAIVCVMVCSVFSLPVNAASYNPSVAIEYAKNHWNDGVGACATFVSNCLKAGGCTAYNSVVINLRNALVNEGWGTEYTLTRTGAYTYKSANEGKLSAGDPIFFYCKTCQAWKHVVICSGFDSSGKAKAYAHNVAWNDKTFANYIDSSGHTGDEIIYY